MPRSRPNPAISLRKVGNPSQRLAAAPSQDFKVINPHLIYTLGLLAAIWLIARLERSPRSKEDPSERDSRTASPEAARDREAGSVRRPVFWFAVVAGILGFAFRIYGSDKSLIVDEFGTLWVVEGDLATLFARVAEFQGQSPFYYLLPWLSAQLLGETEFALRLPSLICGVASIYLIYRLGLIAGGKEAGLLAAGFAWLSFPLVEAGALARPYALAVLMASLMLLGFAQASLQGRGLGRLLFIVGGAGLFSAHYTLVLIAGGVAAGYLLCAELRRRYPPRQFALDVAVQLVLVTVWLPHLGALWNRRGQLLWILETDYTQFLSVIGPFLVFALAGYAARTRDAGGPKSRAIEPVFWLAIAAQVGFLTILALSGTNLLHRRYMLVILIPAVVLAAKAASELPWRFAVLPWCYWVGFAGGALFGHFAAVGTFSTAGYQDWRQSVAVLQSQMRTHPRAPVLYRACLVEEDGHPQGTVSSAIFAPLRSPGRRMPSWNIVPLTYSWWAPKREEYFERAVAPTIADRQVFYLLTCDFYHEGTGNYPELVRQWVEERFPERFASQPMEAGAGTVVVRFERR